VRHSAYDCDVWRKVTPVLPHRWQSARVSKWPAFQREYRALPLGKTFCIVTIVFLAWASQAFRANAQTETNLYSFGSSLTDGANPYARLVQGSDGNFYGTTQDGGTYSYGTVFRISPGGTYTNLYSFGSSLIDGNGPVAGLVQGSDGNFYGTTQYGGLSGVGTVFRISPSGTYTNLYSFGYSPDGFNPHAGLAQGSDGNFYGTTYFGGLSGVGTVYRISPNGTYMNLYSFGGSPADGNFPVGGLAYGDDGNFYGTTQDGGANGYGTVYRISPSGSETNLYSFGGPPADGSGPVAGLVQGNDDNFYGTTQDGGMNSSGTVFRISPNGAYTNLYSFGGSPADGNFPVAGLVQGSDGNFYGTTRDGGANGYGTVYRISLSGAYTNLYSFGGFPTDGSGPVAGLVQGSDGSFYGATFGGGTNNEGTAFAFDVGLGPVSNNCKFSISSTNVDFNAAGGTGSVKVNGPNGCVWTAISYDSFISITSGSGGSGNGTVDYTVAPNTSSNGLMGAMAIAGQTFTVAESGVSTETAVITVQANPSGGGMVSGSGIYPFGSSVRITAIANSGWEFTGWNDKGAQTHDITVPAGGAVYTANFTSNCTYTLSATSVTLTAKGGAKEVSVKVKNNDCPWTAVSNDPFITITGGSSGTGNGRVNYTVAGNTNTTDLSGTMTIAGQTFTVNQDAGGCTFKLSPKSGKLTAAAGNGTVKVSPNLSDCDWTAVSNDSFITITGVASGTGPGMVTYTVSVNTSTSEVTGSITIGGEVFTITQAGVK
jgi:uncharacterized repeat protein (TIGR03803 family)